MIPKRQSSPEQHQSVALSFPRDIRKQKARSFQGPGFNLSPILFGRFSLPWYSEPFSQRAGECGSAFLVTNSSRTSSCVMASGSAKIFIQMKVPPTQKNSRNYK